MARLNPTSQASWQSKLLALAKQAMTLVAPVRRDEIVRRLLSGGDPVDSETTAMLIQAGIIDIALFSAPPGRSSAIERLAKQLRPKPNSDDGRVLAGLLKARLALFELTGGPADGDTLPARDLMTGESLRVESDELAALPLPGGRQFAARLVPVAGLMVVAGATIPLDDALLEVLSPLRSRDGRGWGNALRAAETLYRHAIRYPAITAPGLSGEEGLFPHRPSDGPLHALAHAWSSRPEHASLPPAEERQARAFATCGGTVLDALSAATLARSCHRLDLAAAYERILALILDTLQRRAAIGQSSARTVLDWVDRELTDSRGSCPRRWCKFERPRRLPSALSAGCHAAAMADSASGLSLNGMMVSSVI